MWSEEMKKTPTQQKLILFEIIKLFINKVSYHMYKSK